MVSSEPPQSASADQRMVENTDTPKLDLVCDLFHDLRYS